MTPADYALSSCHRLRQLLADKAEGKVVPDILLATELALLNKRVEQVLKAPPATVLPFPERTSGDEAPAGFPTTESEDHDP